MADKAPSKKTSKGSEHPPKGEKVEHLSHLTSPLLLLGVFGALTALTVATVAVTSIDLGSAGNLVVAMVIATIKAGLVMAFFMHLVWDRPFNALAFIVSLLLLILFLAFAVTDRQEYQEDIDAFETSTAQQ